MESSRLQQPLACVCFAAACSIFYRKNFSMSMLPAVVIIMSIGAYIDTVFQLDVTSVLGLVLLLISLYQFGGDWWHQIYYVSFLCFLSALLDAHFGFLEYICPVPFSYVVRIALLAFPQFLRKPDWVKAKLQRVRAIAGPIYVIFVVTTSRHMTQQPDVTTVIYVLSVSATICAILAGTVFRPDNSILLKPIYATTMAERRRVHRILMTISLVAVLASVCLFLWPVNGFKTTTISKMTTNRL